MKQSLRFQKTSRKKKKKETGIEGEGRNNLKEKEFEEEESFCLVKYSVEYTTTIESLIPVNESDDHEGGEFTG